MAYPQPGSMSVALRALLLTLFGILIILQSSIPLGSAVKNVPRPKPPTPDTNVRGPPRGGSQPAPPSGPIGDSGGPRCASGRAYRVLPTDTCVRLMFLFYKRSYSIFRSANGGRPCLDPLKVGSSVCLPPN
ncbi:hypothetical protein CLOM_g17844 [Closterium sp. NIES-68]|nr:hypothetical protein CLOM_g17844 [Closterium sp. NIES-68]GJP60635.1 hypothetical protein CLOP_g17862 [Closterium sp. NIES-67]